MSNLPIKIVIADPIHDFVEARSTWFIPLSALNIAAYLKQTFGNKVEVHVFKFAHETLDCIDRVNPDFVAVSNYIWNAELGKRILEYAKEKNNKTVTVMGGPNITFTEENVTQFLKTTSCDYFIEDDGEVPFSKLVGAFMDGIQPLHKATDLVSIWYIDDILGSAKKFRGESRPSNINDLPSPFLSGLADNFLKTGLAAMIETNRGCPFSCSFCVWGNESKVSQFDVNRVKDELNRIQAMATDPLLMINDANFGLFKDRDMDIAKHLRRLNEENDWPRTIVVNWGQVRSDTTLEIAEALNNICTLRQASQSFDENVLKTVQRRNTKRDEFQRNIQYSQSRNIETFGELILMLPEESLETYLFGLRQSFEAGIDCVNTNQLQLLEGAPLNTPENRIKYSMKTRWRLLENNYGLYRGKAAIEAEEIVVETNTFSYQECIQCRPLNWLIQMSWTMKRHRELLQLLACFGVNQVDFLMLAVKNFAKAPPSVRQIFERFFKDTEAELFEDYESLKSHYEKEDQMSTLKKGGFKKLNTYYSGLSLWINDDFLDYYRMLAIDLLHETKQHSIYHEKLIDQCITYLKLITLSVEEFESISTGKIVSASNSFDWDFAGWAWNAKEKPLPSKTSAKQHLEIYVTENQEIALRTYMHRFKGPDIDYMLTKLHEPYYGVERKYLKAASRVQTPLSHV